MATRESPVEGLAARFRPPFYGPNPYSREPAVVAALEFTPAALSAGPARCAELAGMCRGWFEPPASFDDGTTALGIAHFIVDWARAALNRHRGDVRTARAVDEDGEIVVALGFHHPIVSRKALQLAVNLVGHAGALDPAMLQRALLALWRECGDQHPDYQIKFLMQAAREADIPYLSVMQIRKIWQFGWGARGELFLESQSGADAALGERLMREKPVTKLFLHGLGVPTPPNALAEGPDQDLGEAARAVGFPCVVKPMNGGRSVGVTTDVADLPQLVAVVRRTLAEHGAPVMIERQVEGDVYRILVAGGRVACVVRRAAPFVVGDGKRTVRELIAARNRELAELRKTMDFVGEIPLDEECATALAREAIGLDEIPARRRKLTLRRIPLLSSGAVYTDVTGETHPDTLRMAELISASLRISNCGIDFITADITRPMNEMGAVLEVNTMPGLRVPMMAGIDPLAIGRLILGERPGRVPAALLIAPAERLDSIRGVAAFDETTGWLVGRTAGLGSLTLTLQRFLGGEATLHQAAMAIIRNPAVERIVIAVALEDIVAAGLPLDKFDTIACLECKPDPAWERVLREATGSYARAKDLGDALRKCGVAAPANKAAGKQPAAKKAAKTTPPRAAPRPRPSRR